MDIIKQFEESMAKKSFEYIASKQIFCPVTGKLLNANNVKLVTVWQPKGTKATKIVHTDVELDLKKIPKGFGFKTETLKDGEIILIKP